MYYHSKLMKKNLALVLNIAFLFTSCVVDFGSISFEKTAKAATVPTADQLIAAGPWIEGTTATVSGSVYKRIWYDDFEDAGKTAAAWTNAGGTGSSVVKSIIRDTAVNSTSGGQYSAKFENAENYMHHTISSTYGQYLIVGKMYDPNPSADIQSIFLAAGQDSLPTVGIANAFFTGLAKNKYLYRFQWASANGGYSLTPTTRSAGWHIWSLDCLRSNEARISLDGTRMATDAAVRRINGIELGNKWASSALTPMYWDDIEVYGPVPAALNVGVTESTGSRTLTATYDYYHLDTSKTAGTPAYKWQIAADSNGQFSDIPGAAGSTYIMQTADANKYIRVQITPKDSSGAEGQSVLSNPVWCDPANISVPMITALSISNSITPGSLTATYTFITGFTGSPEGNSEFRWLVSDTMNGTFSTISGATQRFLLIDSTMYGKFIKVEVTPKDQSGISGTAETSAAIQILLPSVTSVSIDAKTGQGTATAVYTFVTGTSGFPEGSSEFRWYVSDSANGTYSLIAGANQKNVDLGSEYDNKYIKVEITPKDQNGIAGVPVMSGYKKILPSAASVFSAADESTMKSVIDTYKDSLAGIQKYYSKVAAIDWDQICKLMVGQYTTDQQISDKFTAICENIHLFPEKSTVIMNESFEGDLSNAVLEASEDWPVITQDMSHNGQGSLAVTGNATNAVKYTLASTGAYRVVTYIYDDITISKPICIVKLCSGTGSEPTVGLRGDLNQNVWTFRAKYGTAWVATSIQRTTGWHRVEFQYIVDNNIKMLVDNVEAYNSTNDPENAGTFKDTYAVVVGNNQNDTGSPGYVYVDSIGVSSITPMPNVSNLSITKGTPENKKAVFIADYDYSDPVGMPDASYITWYKADSVDGPFTVVQEQTDQEKKDKKLLVAVEDANKYYKFEVTARSLDRRENTAVASSVLQEDYFKTIVPVAKNVKIVGLDGTDTILKIGTTVKGAYQCEAAPGGDAPDPNQFQYQWYFSPTEGGTYEAIAGENAQRESFAPELKHAGGYIKFGIRPVDIDGIPGSMTLSPGLKESTDLVVVINQLIDTDQKGLIVDILPRYLALLDSELSGVAAAFNASNDDIKGEVYKEITIQKYSSMAEIAQDIMKVINQFNSPTKAAPTSTGSGSKSKGTSVSFTGSTIPTPSSMPSPMHDFKDIDHVEWAKQAILAVAAQGIMLGKEEGLFAPDDDVTREEFITILVRAFKLTDDTAESDFLDVDHSAWYYRSVATAQKLGLTSGVDGKIFGVQREISRQEMVTLLYRFVKYMGLDIAQKEDYSSFADEKEIAEYAKEAVKSMNKAGIVRGKDDGMFGPNENSTRAMVAQVIYNLVQINGR